MEFGDRFYMGYNYEGNYGPPSGINELPDGVYEVTLPKPLGIGFEEFTAGRADGGGSGVFVNVLVEDGNGAKSGQIAVGDHLVGVTAVRIQGGKFERGMYECKGWSFDTIVDGIGSNEEKFGCKDVVLQFFRPPAAEPEGGDA